MLGDNKFIIFLSLALISLLTIIFIFSKKDDLRNKSAAQPHSLVSTVLKNGKPGNSQYLRIVGNITKINNGERTITIGYDSTDKDGITTYTYTEELKVSPIAKWNIKNIGDVPDYFSSLKIGDVVEAACQDNPCTILNGLYINTGF